MFGKTYSGTQFVAKLHLKNGFTSSAIYQNIFS